MSQVRIFAPIKGPEGYSLFARDLILQLDQRGVHVCLDEFRNWGPFEVVLTENQHKVLSRTLQQRPYACGKPVTNLNICLPQQCRLVDQCRNVNYTMFEVDGIPDGWVEPIHHLDEIIVPTTFNQWSFTHLTDIPSEKVSVLPIGIDLNRYNPTIDPLPLICPDGGNPLDFPVRFLVVCEITNRKNFLGTLQTFYRVAERIGVKNCCLILKAANYSKQISVPDHIRDFQRHLIAKREIANLPYNIFCYLPLIPEEVHPSFIRLGTHYLTTTFGEGWDMTAMQSAACGLHLFVPHHSAYQCWLDPAVCTFLPIKEKQAAKMDPPLDAFYKDKSWYIYHLASSVDMITAAIENPTLMEVKKRAMQAHIRKYAWGSLLDSYSEVLHLND